MLDFLDFLNLSDTESKVVFALVLKLFVISFIATVLGLNREKNHSPIGIKTLMVIGITSCVITIISVEHANHFVNLYGLALDPMRLPAQIVSGVGFLGAGVIFVRKNSEVSGLTTASMIWGVATLGIAVGTGYILLSLLALIFMVSAVEIFPRLKDFLGFTTLKCYHISVKFTTKDFMLLGIDKLNNIDKTCEIIDFSISEIDNEYKVCFTIYVDKRINPNEIYNKYLILDGVKYFNYHC